MFQKFQPYAKFIVAILTVLVTAGVGLIPADFIDWLQLVIALIGAYAVYVVPNVPATTE
jgi:p-aminobenzoyl-glutamate transporter AbgT